MCDYGNNQCTCWGGTWHCNPCPTSQPSEGSNCGTFGYACNYGNNACGCSFGSTDWACLTCPTTKPTDESACNDQSAICAYQGSFCRCRWDNGLKWDCP
ncbi:MAG: hypothetical protein DYH12_28330 [Sorangiineae bacterium PRO1]|nr:hypothetical protein [Sorangiineae bacterium PRO1]